jgi:hypothetical protein
MTARDIANRLEAVQEAGALLRRRTRSELVETLGQVLDGWADPNSRWRQALVAELPTATGFSTSTVRSGLAAGLDHWTADAFSQLASRELGAESEHVGATTCRHAGFDSTAVVLAGSIPMPTLLSLIAPLALGSPVIAKAAARDRVTPNLVAESIADIDTELGRCVAIVDFARDDEASTQALLSAGCVCATGSDGTIAALQAQVRPPRRIVFDGHRLSVAAIGNLLPADGLSDGRALHETAGRLAQDIAHWDQLGCLSPVVIYAVGITGGKGQGPSELWADQLADALAAALVRAEQEWPRGEIDPGSARDVVRERSEAELRGAAGHNVRVMASDSTAWTVIRENGPELRPAPLHRFIRVVPVNGTDALVEALAPLGPHLAAVGVEGFGEQTPAVCRELAALGASRICRSGAMQSPPIGWHHAGRGVLASLARFSDIEC